jgi:hypothetical protein
MNLELLEQLNVACGWLIEHNMPIPNAETLISLIAKARTLLAEIQADNPKILQYNAIRRKVTEEKSDDKVTEPRKTRLKNGFLLQLRQSAASF